MDGRNLLFQLALQDLFSLIQNVSYWLHENSLELHSVRVNQGM